MAPKAPQQRAASMANTAFILGIVGVIVLPVCLGPVAVVLAVLALKRGTVLRRRAQIGLLLGVLDLVIFAVALAAERSWLSPGLF